MKTALTLIAQARRVYVVTHADPDGDAIGSLLGLGWALDSLGKHVTLACADGVPSPFRFLPGREKVVTAGPAGHDLVIGLDASDPSRYGDAYHPESYPDIPLLVIDHHVTNEGFGAVSLVDPEAAATAEMLFELIQALGVSLDARIATCLLAGLLTDTQGFRTANTTARSMGVAMCLMEAGANLTELTRQLFGTRSLSSLCVLGCALTEMRLDGRIIWSEISQATLRECQATSGDASGVVNVLGSTREADVAVVFREQSDGSVDVGMRAAPGINLAPVATRLGGGGHPQAAGCVLPGPLPAAREQVLQELRHSLDGQAGALPSLRATESSSEHAR